MATKISLSAGSWTGSNLDSNVIHSSSHQRPSTSPADPSRGLAVSVGLLADTVTNASFQVCTSGYRSSQPLIQLPAFLRRMTGGDGWVIPGTSVINA